MDAELDSRLEESGYRRRGFAEHYDRHRTRPPRALLDLLPPLTGVDRPKLVVDIGSGTGLSTRLWAERTDEVVGVEPSKEMRSFAEQATDAPNVRYVGASAYETGLADACADIVTAAQSLQWMRPERVFPEVGRVLRPGGVFCAYEYFALQTPLWEPEAQWHAVRVRTRELRAELGLNEGARVWPVSQERLAAAGVFRHTRELALHSIDSGDGDRLVGLALSEGSLTTLLDAGATEDDVGLGGLRAASEKMTEPVLWWIGYRVWLGLR
jgi:SAM-dependent methyltransferase